MQLINNTVFSVMSFDHWDQAGGEVSVVVVKAVLFRQDGRWAYAPDTVKIAHADIFDGEPATGVLSIEQEIAPEKVATDLMVRAIAYAPDDGALADWPVSIEIPGRLSYGFQVRGPSSWASRKGGWHLSSPEPVRSVPIRYQLAYGGTVAAKNGTEQTFEYNPAGRGYTGSGPAGDRTEIPAPQIGLLADFMSEKFGKDMAVHGFGPIAKAWLPRRGLAGTLDDAWARTRHPRMPEDFDPRFWNAAPGPLQLSPFLRGDEVVRFINLRPDAPEYGFALPGISVAGKISPDNHTVRFNLDTVSIDIEAPDTDDHNVTLIWRARFPASDSIEALEIDMVGVEELNEE